MHRVRILLALVMLLSPSALQATEIDQTANSAVIGGPRIRPDESRAVKLLIEGIRRSGTIRALVDRIEDSDVIVYVQMEPTLRKTQLGGMLTWVTATARFRYVRVSINPELGFDRAIAVLGHELQHAVEVANAPAIISASSLEAHYRKHGIAMGQLHTSEWDTEAARVMGDDVRRELAGARNLRTTESLQAFDPRLWHVVYRQARERS